MPVVNDTASAVVEDSAAAIISQGNVLANDTISGVLNLTRVVNQLGNSVSVFPATLAGTYGSIVFQADGSYTYTINNALAAVQSLGAGQPASDHRQQNQGETHEPSARNPSPLLPG